MRTLNMKMPEKLYEDLTQKAKDMNISLAALIRLVCSEYLDKQK
ncbi:ribbon-helix-helix protein, CopG family [Paenibacillus polymyxa]|nr:ribbon-helix-helix protein, CopG family [Paenibacillus sp. AK121]MEE4566363.1 ribbon-helix-helix protein, CopG family [Paenibacillus polymyxa]